MNAIELQTGHRKLFASEDCEYGYRCSIFKNQLHNKFLITGVILELRKTANPTLNYSGLRLKLQHIQTGLGLLNQVDIREAICVLRGEKLPDPVKLGNAGSFFKNPIISKQKWQTMKVTHPTMPEFKTNDKDAIKVSGGWLIENSDCRDLCSGEGNGVGIYEKHSLVIVNNDGNTSGKNILNLAENIKIRVAQRFGIELVSEVDIVLGKT